MKIPPQLPAALALGIACQIAQIVLLRELLMVFYGNELSIGIILAAWMAWVGIGSWGGASFAGNVKRPLMPLAMSGMGVLLVLPGTILLVRLLRGFFDTLPGEHLSFSDTALSCFLLMAPLCFLLGAQYVLLSRVWRESIKTRDTSGATQTYIFEATGSVIGGLIFTLLLVHHLNSFQCAFVVGMLMLVGIAWLSLSGQVVGERSPAWLRPAPLVLLVLAGSLWPWLPALETWADTIQWKLLAPKQRLVETRHSKYGTISVLAQTDQYNFFRNGQLAFSTAGPETESFELEEQSGAVLAHLSLTQHQNPKRVLLIGGGLRGVLREMARHPVDLIDYVELDRVLIDVAAAYVPAATREALQMSRVQVVTTDARLYVKESDRSYDLIVVDLPDPSTAVVNRFYTVEFFREAKRLLNPGGVLATGVTSPGRRAAAVVNRNATVYHTLRSVFAHVLPLGEGFCFLFATDSPGQVSADVNVLRGRYLARNVETKGFSERYYYSLLEESQVRRLNWILRHHGRRNDSHLVTPEFGPLSPGTVAEQEVEEARLPPVLQRYFINSDFRPIGYYYTLALWNALARTEHAAAFHWILRVKTWWILPIVGFCFLTMVVLRSTAHRKRADVQYAILFAIFTTGLSTMVFQIVVLFSFQSIYGFVYEMIGFIVAVFMGGLALGAAGVHRFVRDKTNIRTLALVQLAIALFACLMAVGLPATSGVTSSRVVFVLFSLIAFFAGLLSGADFPLATGCCLRLNRRAERSAGIVYGVELLGGCIGAVVAGAVVVPVLGIVPCCLLAAIMNATAFLVLMSCQGSSR